MRKGFLARPTWGPSNLTPLIFTERYLDWQAPGKESRYRPDLTPSEIKRILMETSRPMTFEGNEAPRVVDAAAALTSVIQ